MREAAFPFYRRLLPALLAVCVGWFGFPGGAAEDGKAPPAPVPVPVPVIYGTDLFHPHDDPDDHFDLATLYALPGIDLRGIVLDQGRKQLERPGRIPIGQLNALTGRRVPWAIGLESPLPSPTDRGLEQAEPFQAGVRLILDTLRVANRRVDLVAVGSVRDIVAAFNREPDLFREKAGRVLVFIGEATNPGFREYNVALDPQAYVGLMRSGLDVYWVPCFDGGLWKNDGRASFWQARHGDLLGRAPAELVQFFLYALEKEKADPIEFLRRPVDPVRREALFGQTRNLWCAAVFRALAAREPVAGETAGLPFVFESVPIAVTDDGVVRSGPAMAGAAGVRTVHRFRLTDPARYAPAMTRATADLLAAFPVARN